MKELSSHSNKEEIKIQAEKVFPKEHKLLGHFKPQKGQYCWELNLTTKEVKLAEFEPVDIDYRTQKKAHKKLIVKPMHLYCVALNLANAKKKFIQQLSKL